MVSSVFQTQQSITNYFLPPAIGEAKGLKSKRVKHILQRMRNQNSPTPEVSASNKSPASSPQKPTSRTPERPAAQGSKRSKRGSPRGLGRTAATVRARPVADVVLSESSSDSDGEAPLVAKVTNQASKRPAARGRGRSRARGKRSRK